MNLDELHQEYMTAVRPEHQRVIEMEIAEKFSCESTEQRGSDPANNVPCGRRATFRPDAEMFMCDRCYSEWRVA